MRDIDCQEEASRARVYSEFDDQSRIKNEHGKNPRRLSSDEIQALILDYKNGATVYELGAQYGCHRVTIGKILKRNGIQPSIKANLDIEKVFTLYSCGTRTEDIAGQFNVSASTIRRYLRENGATMKTRWDYIATPTTLSSSQ